MQSQRLNPGSNCRGSSVAGTAGAAAHVAWPAAGVQPPPPACWLACWGVHACRGECSMPQVTESGPRAIWGVRGREGQLLPWLGCNQAAGAAGD